MIIEYHTRWDEENSVFVHYAIGELEGFPMSAGVESHDEMMSAWDRDQIRESFKQMAIQMQSAPAGIQ